jgi:putative sterol carrier protein
MGRLPLKVTARSRWLVAAMLASHDESKRIARPTTWELRLSDSAFAARAEGTHLTITAGAPDRADLVITTKDEELHRLMTHALTPDTAVATGAMTLDGDVTALPCLLELVAFPPSQ